MTAGFGRRVLARVMALTAVAAFYAPQPALAAPVQLNEIVVTITSTGPYVPGSRVEYTVTGVEPDQEYLVCINTLCYVGVLADSDGSSSSWFILPDSYISGPGEYTLWILDSATLAVRGSTTFTVADYPEAPTPTQRIPLFAISMPGGTTVQRGQEVTFTVTDLPESLVMAEGYEVLGTVLSAPVFLGAATFDAGVHAWTWTVPYDFELGAHQIAVALNAVSSGHQGLEFLSFEVIEELDDPAARTGGSVLGDSLPLFAVAVAMMFVVADVAVSARRRKSKRGA